MYPQQQQQQQQQQYQVPTFNLQQQQQQQPYYSSYPTDSSLHPPGTDPIANSTPFSASAYVSQTTDYQNWVVQQPQPITYDLAVGSSQETSAATASLLSAPHATWPNQVYGYNTTAVLPNQTKALRCEVCKIDVNSQDVYEKHISGKKHKKNLQVQTNPTIAPNVNVQSNDSSIQGQVLEPKDKEHVAVSCPVKVCSTCNTICTSEDAYNSHLAGRKHAKRAAQVGSTSNNVIGPSTAEFKRPGVGSFKKIKVAQSAWCEVCKINCNSRDMYINHLAGKKHLKNLEKISNPKIEVGTNAATTSNTLIGPQENPDSDKPKPKKASELDIETKRRKVVEGGAAAGAVKTCTLCNVVCNSETVFNTHLTGQKHAAMVKKAGSSTA